MVLPGIGRTEKHRIIPPYDTLRPQPGRQLPEGFYQLILMGKSGFHIRPIGCQGKLEIIGIPQPVQNRKPLHHRARVLCPEHKAVHGVLVQKNLADLPGIHGVLYIQVPFLQPFEKPVRIKRRNVCPSAGTDDHGGSSLLCLTRQSV